MTARTRALADLSLSISALSELRDALSAGDLDGARRTLAATPLHAVPASVWSALREMSGQQDPIPHHAATPLAVERESLVPLYRPIRTDGRPAPWYRSEAAAMAFAVQVEVRYFPGALADMMCP